MKQYFIHNGKDQEGPFSFEELKQKGITSKTSIWFEGISAWTEAQNIEELKPIFISSPPPFEKPSVFSSTINSTKKIIEKDIVNEIGSKIKTKDGKNAFKWVVVFLAIIGLFAIVKFMSSDSFFLFSSNKVNSLDSIAVKNCNGTAHYNEYDKDWEVRINGLMLNKSENTSFKDFEIEVQFMARTGTLIETKKYTIFQTILPLERKDFYCVLESTAPSGSNYYNLTWKLLGAQPIVKDKNLDSN